MTHLFSTRLMRRYCTVGGGLELHKYAHHVSVAKRCGIDRGCLCSARVDGWVGARLIDDTTRPGWGVGKG